MNIMVLDIPTTNGGGLTILLQYYKRALNDKSNNWFFVVGKPAIDLDEKDNIKVLRFPKVKKNWIKRFFFDCFFARKLANEYKIERILSLQGSIVRRYKCYQTLYIQQALFFSDYPTNLFLEPRIWFYKNIMSRFRKYDLKKANSIIVQTDSTRELCAQKYKISKEKFIVEEPDVVFSTKKRFEKIDETLFFYPTGSYIFKNVDIIIDALDIVVSKTKKDFEVLLTIGFEQNKVSKKWFDKCNKKNLPVKFIGYQKFDEMEKLYASSILLFPSYTESFGLPLLEARYFGSPIIAADKGYAHDVLKGYDNVVFFNVNNKNELAELMLEYINSK